MSRRGSLVENVYAWLLARLSERKFQSGEHLHPQEIAEKLGVSSATVRKALMRALEDGWVQRNSNGRVVVRAFPRKRKRQTVDFISSDSHVDVAHRALREKVLRGELEPGEAINAYQLSKELGISMPALGQALEAAAAQGLLQRLPRRGWRVAVLTPTEIKDVFRMRLRMETMLIPYTIRRISDEELEELAADCEEIGRIKSPSQYDYRQVDYRFHTRLAEASGRRIVAETLKLLLKKVFINPGVRPPGDTFSEHEAILDALRRRNVDEAVEAMRRHLTQSAKRYVAQAAQASLQTAGRNDS